MRHRPGHGDDRLHARLRPVAVVHVKVDDRHLAHHATMDGRIVLPMAVLSAVVVGYALTRRRRKKSAPVIVAPPVLQSGCTKHHLLRDFVIERIVKRRGGVHIFETLPPRNTALVVIDMQHTFLQEGAPVEVPLGRQCVAPINKLADAVRARGGRVIFIAHANNVLGEGDNDWRAFRCSFVSGVNRTRYVESLSPGAKGQQIWPVRARATPKPRNLTRASCTHGQDSCLCRTSR